MRSCLTAFLFTILLIGAIIGVGALALGQVHQGLCTDQTLRLLAGLIGGGLVIFAILLVLLWFLNRELLEKSLSGGQISIISFSAAVVGVGIAALITYHSAQSSCPRIVDASSGLNEVCNGVGLSRSSSSTTIDGKDAQPQSSSVMISASASEITTLLTGSNADRLVILGEMGTGSPFTEQARKEWTPADNSQIDLAICTGIAKQIRIETCSYGGGIKINRYREELPVRLVKAQTGQTLVSAVLSAVPPACQPMGLQDLAKLRAHVAYSDLKTWVTKIQAGKPAPGITPKPTNTPFPPTATATLTPIPSPTPTPQINGKVTMAARLRSEPSMNGKVIDGLTQGTKVLILGVDSTGAWFKVLTPKEKFGWIYASLVKTNTPLDQIPKVP